MPAAPSRRAALVLCVLALSLLAGCGDAPPATDEAEVATAQHVIGGVPQRYITLGQTDAPWTLTVYASLADFNGAFHREVLPAVVREYVDRGRLKLQLRPVTDAPGAFGEEDAERAARVAQAAALQDRMWEFFATWSLRYTGVVDTGELRAALRAVPGLDVEEALRDARSARTRRAVARADERAEEIGFVASPTFTLMRRGGRERVLRAAVPGGLPAALDARIGSGA